MRIGINGWRIHGQRTGVGRYLLNVARHWTAEATGDPNEINFYTPRPLDRQQIPLPGNIRERVLRPDARMLIWENVVLGPRVSDDVLFCPSFTRPLIARAKTVVATHDAIQHMHPEFFPKSVRYLYNPLYSWSAQHATLVITDSEAAKRDITQAMGVPAEKIRVTYLAPASVFRRLPYAIQGDPPFFLFVGKISGRRSLPHLLEAFALFKAKTAHPHRLYLVGLNPHNLELGKLADGLRIGPHIHYCGYVSDEELNGLYNSAEAFVMPAVYESSSLPVMEAQAAGLPVICLNTSGMRESTDGAALLVERLDPTLLFEAMVRMAEDAGLRERLSTAGLASATRFSWERCSAETLNVLKEAASTG